MKTRIALILIFLAAASGCEKETHELKSPCVGAEGSPCGDKRPVNAWWLRQA